MIDKKLLQILVCPETKSKLILVDNELVSSESKLAYPIRDGIPILLKEEARLISSDEIDKLV
jgi:uncharacterized protein YbaR (Trm112 family)|tara:strand:+ start:386 stop:571 length:186 start_codon:yes stop_codon:yes gene_type:complete